MKATVLLGLLLWQGALAPAFAAPATTATASAVATMPATANVPLPTPQFRRYGTADGMPSTNVYAMVQDRDGAIWFGTKGGLAWFDGVQFKVYRHVENDPGSLFDNGIATLLIDHRGQLWAAGLNAGLNRYDAASGKFLHWGHQANDPASLASDRVWAIAQSADGDIWVGGVGGVDRMRRDQKGFDHVLNPLLSEKPAAFGMVAALYVDAQQRLWIGSSNGVFVRQADGEIRRVESDDPARRMPDAWRFEGDGDEVRIATSHGLMIVGKDGVAHRFAPRQTPDTDTMSSVRDQAGRLWVGTKRGLFLQEQANGPVTAVSNQSMLYGNLPGTWVWQLMVDREGGLWAALYDGGVAYLAPGWDRFSRFTHVPDDPASLRDSIATAMARGKDGRHVWVGERGGRVDRLDPVTGQVEHVLSDLGGDVVGMTEDAKHRLWVVAQGALYLVTDGKPRRVDAESKMQRPLEVEPGPDGQMYARTFGQGVFRIDPQSLVVTPVLMDGSSDKVLWGSQMTLKDGVYWYASDGGMMRLDAAHARFEMVPGAPAGQSVDAFDFAGNGVWMANANGLAFYRYSSDGVVLERRIDATHGWPSVSVTDLHVDKLGRVWIFGHDGLWYFDPQTGRFRSFGLQDGLTNGEFSRGYALMPSGYIYAATLGGVAAFDPNGSSLQAQVPQLSITRLSVRRHGERMLLPINAQPLRIGWQDSQLQVEARVFSYVNPAANHYRFRLVGFDRGWVDTDDRGERDFSGLGAGDYSLEVMASGARGSWTHLGSPLRLQVQAPPWERWWAWLVYAAMVGLMAWMVLLSWRRRLAHRHQIQLAEQRSHLAEQASAAKTLFLATLSHEIRTPMTGVMGMAELLKSTPLSEQQQDYTDAMQRSGTMLLKLLNDALDLARIEAGRLELELAPFDPRQLLQDVAQLEQGLAHAKGIRFELEGVEALPAQVVGDVLRIKQVLLNLASNALKFTEHGQVSLRGERIDEGLMFSISDTGPGIPEASQARLFQRFEQEEGPQRRVGSGLGLAICRELVEMMGGSIELVSRLGHGSTFHVRLPLAAPVLLSPAVPPVVVPGRYRLLLVEDDGIVAAVIRGLLERQGHGVVHVINGLAALTELAHETFDAVLLDLDLPGVDGFQITRLIRQREPAGEHLPIVAVTARSGSEDEARAKVAGMDGFLRKPLTGEQLAEALQQVIGTAVPVPAQD